MGVSRPENVDRADHIGVVLITASHALESGLRLAVVGSHMAAARTGSARVRWRHCTQPAALPRQLVIQLAAELEPAWIEDGLVQAGLGPNVSSRLFGSTCR